MELVIASSSIDAGIACWDLNTGAEQPRFKQCASPPHGLVCVGERFLASSQLRNTPDGSVKYWSWTKPQPEVRSSHDESIKPLAATWAGTYMVGGGKSGKIYLWEVLSGRLLKKWDAHYRAVSCLVFSECESVLYSASEDGEIRIWNLVDLLDEYLSLQGNNLYMHSLTKHSLGITDMVAGFGRNPILVSASEDRTCKVWDLPRGTLLRNIVFPSIVDAIAMDPCEQAFYAGCRDGNIYVAALHTTTPVGSKYGTHIITRFSNHSKSVTCLKYVASGDYLISGSEDGVVRVWDAKTLNIVRVLKHATGPVNNILVVTPHISPDSQTSSRRYGSSIPPPLEKRAYEGDNDRDFKVVLGLHPICSRPIEPAYITTQVMESQIRELQQQGAGAAEMEIERLRVENERSAHMAQQWRQMHENLHQFCVDEILDGDEEGSPKGSDT